jgi:DNA-binding MarR family transcriptional regulator
MTVIRSILTCMEVETRIERVRRDPDLGLLTAWLLDPIRDELFARLAERGHDQIRPCHRALLGYLDDAGARPTEIARVMDQPKQYIGRLVDELETLGYVQRRPDPRDRRSKLIVPTARGRDEQEQADIILADIEARHAARIGAERYADFRRLLRSLALPDET